MGYIYKITNTVNGKAYIGKSINEPEKGRIKDHLGGYGGSPYLAKAVKKYGKSVFEYKILEKNVIPELLTSIEMSYISAFNTLKPNGYNLMHYHEGVIRHSEETRRKIAENQIGRKHSYETRRKMSKSRKGRKLSEEHSRKISEGKRKQGYKHSPETRRKIGIKHIGRKLSEEHRRKISQSNTGRKFSEQTKRKIAEANTGRKHTPEVRAKMSAAQKANPSRPMLGKKHTPESKAKMSAARKGKPSHMKGKSHTKKTKHKIAENLKTNPLAVKAQKKATQAAILVNTGKPCSPETRQKISNANASPYREPAHQFFLSLPESMPLSEKRKILREQFPNIANYNIHRWTSRWQSSVADSP